jgi:hypothetical protein
MVKDTKDMDLNKKWKIWVIKIIKTNSNLNDNECTQDSYLIIKVQELVSVI